MNKMHVISMITGALGTVHRRIEEWLERIVIKEDFTILQKP